MKQGLILLAILVLVSVPIAFADCDGAGVVVCTVRDLSGIVLSDGDDDLTIEKGARVRSDSGYGVDAGYGNDRVLNHGDISARVRGIFGDTGNDTLINTGTIRDGDSGIYGGIGNDYIENSGTITARQVGIEAADVDAFGDFDVVLNTGSIQAISSHGIYTTGEINNSGRVNSRRDGLVGIRVTNTGRVISYGGVGIKGHFTDDVLINNGSVQGLVGMAGMDGNDLIENSGSIVGGIEGGSGNDTIILYDNSSIRGVINCGTDFDTLIFAQTLSASDLARLEAFIAAKNTEALGYGSITINRQTFTWEFCETIVSELKPRP